MFSLRLDQKHQYCSIQQIYGTMIVNSMEVMQFHLRAWKLCGMWPRKPSSRPCTIPTLFLWTICFVVFPLLIAMQLYFAATLNEFIEIALVLPTAMVGIKAAMIMINRKRFLMLFDLMHRLDIFNISQPEHQHIVSEQIRGSRFLLTLLSGEYIVSMAAQCLAPIISADRILMFGLPRFDPFNYRQSLTAYFFVITYQFVACSTIAFVSLSMDLYGLALFKMLGAHIDVLTDKFRRVGKIKCGKAEAHRLAENELRQCVLYHNLCNR